ncbi:MAG TPA: DUF2812 domain-containing protein [Desulfosporosinus sp.]|nr:DUF2812 domain-containing protein [Desulfosporosinus sp.]
MRHIEYKAFSIAAFEKEEKWLNEMSEKGMQLVSVGFCRYEFEQGMPSEYVYRLEFLDSLPTSAESVAYIKFLKETGVDHVSSFFRWVYLRKKSIEGPFELYSEINSKIKHYKRINYLCNFLIVFELIIAIIEFWAAWYKYTLNGDWFSLNTFFSVFITVLAAIIFLIGHPVRKTLKALKKEQLIRE